MRHEKRHMRSLLLPHDTRIMRGTLLAQVVVISARNRYLFELFDFSVTDWWRIMGRMSSSQCRNGWDPCSCEKLVSFAHRSAKSGADGVAHPQYDNTGDRPVSVSPGSDRTRPGCAQERNHREQYAGNRLKLKTCDFHDYAAVCEAWAPDFLMTLNHVERLTQTKFMVLCVRFTILLYHNFDARMRLIIPRARAAEDIAQAASIKTQQYEVIACNRVSFTDRFFSEQLVCVVKAQRAWKEEKKRKKRRKTWFENIPLRAHRAHNAAWVW